MADSIDTRLRERLDPPDGVVPEDIDGVLDCIGGPKVPPSASQRLMEAPFYALGYEAVFRPALTRLVTRQTVEGAMRLSSRLMCLESDDVVLDVGCGTGNFTRTLARSVGRTTGLVVGLDLSAPMLARGEALRRQDELPQVRFVRGDATRLPFVDDAFDAVHTAGALHLMPDVDGVLAELARVVRPGGRLVIGTFVLSRDRRLRRAERAVRPLIGFRFFDDDDLRARIEAAGFDVLDRVVDGLAITLGAERRADRIAHHRRART